MPLLIVVKVVIPNIWRHIVNILCKSTKKQKIYTKKGSGSLCSKGSTYFSRWARQKSLDLFFNKNSHSRFVPRDMETPCKRHTSTLSLQAA